MGFLQISPPIVQQFGQFVISVKNNKKLDAEKIRKLEFKIVAEETGPAGQVKWPQYVSVSLHLLIR